MKKIRTIQSAYEYIKSADPDTSVTPSAIRRAVTSGEIPSRRIGAKGGWKYMVDVDLIEAYFCGEEVR